MFGGDIKILLIYLKYY